jgi:hypothetical protein
MSKRNNIFIYAFICLIFLIIGIFALGVARLPVISDVYLNIWSMIISFVITSPGKLIGLDDVTRSWQWLALFAAVVLLFLLTKLFYYIKLRIDNVSDASDNK